MAEWNDTSFRIGTRRPGRRTRWTARRATHVESCAACREQVGGAPRDAARDGVDRRARALAALLGALLRRGCAGRSRRSPPPAGPAGHGSGLRGLVPFAAAAAVVIAVFSGVLPGARGARRVRCAVADGRRTAPRVTDAAPDGRIDGAAGSRQRGGLGGADRGGVHRRVRTTPTTSGCTCTPAAIDHAVQDLSAAELTELGRLLQSELKRSSN